MSSYKILKVIQMGARRKKFRFGFGAIIAITVVAFSLGALAGVALSRLFVPGENFATSENIWLAENLREASVKIAAVSSDGSTGVVSNLTVEITPGTGRVLVDTHPLIGFDFQYAGITAVKVASGLTGYALDDDGEGLKGANVLFTVSTQSGESVEVQAVDGPSAGAATTVATIAALENKKVKENVIMTGTINDDGSIGPVGGIFEKAKAANDAGAELFLVPHGQSVLTMYREVIQQRGPFRWVTYEPVIVDLNEYAENAGWGIRIQEVSAIGDAMELMLE
jgi:uncharacterized protein